MESVQRITKVLGISVLLAVPLYFAFAIVTIAAALHWEIAHPNEERPWWVQQILSRR